MNVNAKFDVHTVTSVPICTLVPAGISLSGLWHANIFMLFILPSGHSISSVTTSKFLTSLILLKFCTKFSGAKIHLL